MSTIQKNQAVWTNIPDKPLDSKYEKCRNITEEIYKRINITFQIKQLETAAQSEISDHSDEIDSNELSNGTDLFACDKSDITSSTEAERPQASCEKYININNNEELKTKKAITAYKRPRKRFRKRVKKRPQRTHGGGSDSDASSDEAPSRVAVAPPMSALVMPNLAAVARDIKPKPHTYDRNTTKNDLTNTKKADCYEFVDDDQTNMAAVPTIDKGRASILNTSVKREEKTANLDWESCSECGLTYRGKRALRRHKTKAHPQKYLHNK